MTKKYIIFDLDGTLADITARRAKCSKVNSKGKDYIDWKQFFAPENISLDEPNWPVIESFKALQKAGYTMVIFSGRSDGTQEATKEWLGKYGVHPDLMRMRPQDKMYMPDNDLKAMWLEEEFPGNQKDQILCIYDDRDKVVKMWREKGLTCFQVAPGDF